MAKAKGGGNKGGAAASATAPNLGALLAAAVAAVQSNQVFYATKADMQGLIAHSNGQLVEYNENMKQGDKIAFRPTALGMQALASGAFGAPQPPAAPAPTPGPTWGQQAPQGGTAPNAPAAAQTDGAAPKTFNFESNVPIPTARRGGRGQNTYGFEQMNVGQSFFIPKSDDNPNPGKRVASTVSGATKRYAPKAFIVRSVEGGARVWRTA